MHWYHTGGSRRWGVARAFRLFNEPAALSRCRYAVTFLLHRRFKKTDGFKKIIPRASSRPSCTALLLRIVEEFNTRLRGEIFSPSGRKWEGSTHVIQSNLRAHNEQPVNFSFATVLSYCSHFSSAELCESENCVKKEQRKLEWIKVTKRRKKVEAEFRVSFRWRLPRSCLYFTPDLFVQVMRV